MAVADECDKMAELFDLSDNDKKVLHTAALLHDITKEKSPDEQITLCRVYQIEYNETDLLTPALFHAKTGAVMALKLFPTETCNQTAELIRSHTTGCVGMSLMQKLLLLADGIEITRKHETLVSLRKYFYENFSEQNKMHHLDLTVIMYLNITIEFLLNSGQVIDIQTISARNDLISKRGNYEKRV